MSNNLSIPQVTASQAQKEVAINDGNAYIDAVLTELITVSLTSANATLTLAIQRSGSVFKGTGHTVARDVTFVVMKRNLSFWNAGTGIVSLKLGTTTIAVPPSALAQVYIDGTANGLMLTAPLATLGVSFSSQTASYTLALTDAGKLVEMSNASANNLTVPPNSTVAFAIGTQIPVVQTGAGQTAFVAGAGVTIRSLSGNLKITGQYAGATLTKRATNEWLLLGSLVP